MESTVIHSLKDHTCKLHNLDHCGAGRVHLVNTFNSRKGSHKIC